MPLCTPVYPKGTLKGTVTTSKVPLSENLVYAILLVGKSMWDRAGKIHLRGMAVCTIHRGDATVLNLINGRGGGAC